MNPQLISTIAQLSYLVLTISLAIWVCETLHKNGRLFVVDAFHGDEARGAAVNQLLRVGFYLVNLGFIMFFLSTGTYPEVAGDIIPYLAQKLGVVSIVLGGMHYFNMRNIAKMRSRATKPGALPQTSLA